MPGTLTTLILVLFALILGVITFHIATDSSRKILKGIQKTAFLIRIIYLTIFVVVLLIAGGTFGLFFSIFLLFLGGMWLAWKGYLTKDRIR